MPGHAVSRSRWDKPSLDVTGEFHRALVSRVARCGEWTVDRRTYDALWGF